MKVEKAKGMIIKFLLVLLTLNLFLTGNAWALSRSASFDELVEKSDLVVSGTVVAKKMSRESFLIDVFSMDDSGNTIKRVKTFKDILTEYEIELSQVIRGAFDEPKIHLTVWGGVVGDIGEETSDSFNLTKGKKYYFFLHHDQNNDRWWAQSSQQGVFEEIEEDGEVFLRCINGDVLLDYENGFKSGLEYSNRNRLSVEQFISRVRGDHHD